MRDFKEVQIANSRDINKNTHVSLLSMKEQHTSQLSALGATVSELKSSLSKSASCLEVAEGKLEGLLYHLDLS